MSFFNSVGSALGARVTPEQQQTLDRLKGEIERGVKDGTLTSPESQRLYTELAQLKAQMQAPKASGWFAGVANAVKAQAVASATARLEQNINAERSNGNVDFAKLMRSNIGIGAQLIQQLGASIQRAAKDGLLSPREQSFLNTKLDALKQTFTNAIKDDGKLDAAEQAQLTGMIWDLAADTFELAARGNPFTQYVPPGDPGAVVTKAIPEEATSVGDGGPRFVTMAIPEEGTSMGGGAPGIPDGQRPVTMAVPEEGVSLGGGAIPDGQRLVTMAIPEEGTSMGGGAPLFRPSYGGGLVTKAIPEEGGGFR